MELAGNSITIDPLQFECYNDVSIHEGDDYVLRLLHSELCEYICAYLYTYLCCPSKVLSAVKMVCECLC